MRFTLVLKVFDCCAMVSYKEMQDSSEFLSAMKLIVRQFNNEMPGSLYSHHFFLLTLPVYDAVMGHCKNYQLVDAGLQTFFV